MEEERGLVMSGMVLPHFFSSSDGRDFQTLHLATNPFVVLGVNVNIVKERHRP